MESLSAPWSRVYRQLVPAELPPRSRHFNNMENPGEEENNRGNGASAAGFKPPATTHKQQRPGGSGERRKTATVPGGAGSRCGAAGRATRCGLKRVFCCFPRFCFSTVATPRAPGNRPRALIGRRGGRGGVSRGIPPCPARSAANTFQRCSRQSRPAAR